MRSACNALVLLAFALGLAGPVLAQTGMAPDRRVDLGRQFKASTQATPEERRVLLDAQEGRVALPPDINARVRKFLEEGYAFESLAAEKTPVLGTLLIWNEVAMLATALDHTNPNPPGQPPPPYFGEQFGPPRSARVLAIEHIAMDEAVNAISPLNPSYKNIRAAILAGLDPAETEQLWALQAAGGRATLSAINRAITEAAYLTLVELYPKKKNLLDIAYELALAKVRNPRSPSDRCSGPRSEASRRLGDPSILRATATSHSPPT